MMTAIISSRRSARSVRSSRVSASRERWGMNAPESPEPTGRQSILTEVRDDDSPGITHDHEGNTTLSVDEKADLATNFKGEQRNFPGEFPG